MLAPGVLLLGACSTTAAKPAASASAHASVSAAAAAPTAGGSSNVGLSDVQVHARIAEALATATTLRVTSTFPNDPGVEQFRLRPDGHCDESGSTEIFHVTSTFETVDGVKYVHLSDQLIAASGDFTGSSAPRSSYDTKWVASTSMLGMEITQFVPSAQGAKCLGEFTFSNTYYEAKGAGTLGGTPVAKYLSDGVSNITLPASGPALPLRASISGDGGGEVTLSWNVPVSITAPPAADILTDVPA